MRYSFRALGGLIAAIVVAPALAQDTSIRVGGSTTALPIISACAAHFMEKFPSWDRADASLNKDATVVYVTGGGSGFGVKGLMNGTIDIGMVSRDLKDTEVSALGQPVMKVFARDAVAIATSASNPISRVKQGFTQGELVSIFSGQFAELVHIDKSLPAKPVVLLTRDASGGVTEIFQDRVMKQQRLAPSRLQFPSTAALVKKLESNDAAIAFVSAGAVSQDGDIRVYSVDGVAPTQENITNDKYTLNRPMQVVAKANPTRKVQAFIDYVLGDCQQVVKDHGFVPVRAIAQ
jgi:phosphate transport system substrate-binding protein